PQASSARAPGERDRRHRRRSGADAPGERPPPRRRPPPPSVRLVTPPHRSPCRWAGGAVPRGRGHGRQFPPPPRRPHDQWYARSGLACRECRESSRQGRRPQHHGGLHPRARPRRWTGRRRGRPGVRWR
ncbi:Os04g0479900, partial [Oryza sativa Japonica Group]